MISGHRQRQIFHYNKIIRILKKYCFCNIVKATSYTILLILDFHLPLEVQGDLTKNAAHENVNNKFTIPWVATSYLENINITVYDLSTAFHVRTLNSLCFTSFHNVLQMCTRDAANPPVYDVQNMYLHWYSPYLGCNHPLQELSEDCSHTHYLSDNPKDKKKSRGFRSGECVAYSVSHLLLIIRSPSRCFSHCRLSFEVWGCPHLSGIKMMVNINIY